MFYSLKNADVLIYQITAWMKGPFIYKYNIRQV